MHHTPSQQRIQLLVVLLLRRLDLWMDETDPPQPPSNIPFNDLRRMRRPLHPLRLRGFTTVQRYWRRGMLVDDNGDNTRDDSVSNDGPRR